MAERVIFEYKADREGSSVQFSREAAGLFAPGHFLRRVWGRPQIRPFGIPLRRPDHRRQIRRALEALRRMYAELYGGSDSESQRGE